MKLTGVLVMLLSIFALPLAASAQSLDDFTEEEREQLERARRRFEIGELLFEDRDFLGAAEAFAEAWELSHHIYADPIVGYNAARSYENAGVYDRASEFYQATLALDLTQFPIRQQRCEDALVRIDNLLAQIEEERTRQPARVTIRSIPEGADVLIDGELSGTTPIELALQSGEYQVSLAMTGYFGHDEPLSLEPGQVIVLQITLDEDTPEIPIDPEEDEGPNWLAVGLVAGGGAAFIGLGALLAIETERLYDEAQETNVLRDDQLFTQTIQEGRGAQGGSYFMYGLGGVAFATAIVLYFVTDTSLADENEADQVQIDLNWGPQGAGGTLSLEW